jgi:hypothetical protein
MNCGKRPPGGTHTGRQQALNHANNEHLIVQKKAGNDARTDFLSAGFSAGTAVTLIRRWISSHREVASAPAKKRASRFSQQGLVTDKSLRTKTRKHEICGRAISANSFRESVPHLRGDRDHSLAVAVADGVSALQ